MRQRVACSHYAIVHELKNRLWLFTCITVSGYHRGMTKKETYHDALVRRLKQFEGQHARIAAECGISQASISRIYLRKCSPTIDVAQRLSDGLDRHERACKGRKAHAVGGVVRAAATV